MERQIDACKWREREGRGGGGGEDEYRIERGRKGRMVGHFS